MQATHVQTFKGSLKRCRDFQFFVGSSQLQFFVADASWSKKTRQKWTKNTPARHVDSSPSFFNKQTPLASKVIVRVHLMILTLRTQGSSSRKKIFKDFGIGTRKPNPRGRGWDSNRVIFFHFKVTQCLDDLGKHATDVAP